jgi:exopolysaccharide production protein ExoZ
MESGRGQKYVNVQVLRLVAALLVVGTHSTLYSSQHLAPGVVWHFGEVGVDLFFVISGFVMMTSSWRHLKKPGYGRMFLAKRVIRIVPMYWIATTLNLVLVLALPTLTDASRPSAARVVLSYLFVSTESPDGRMEPIHGVGWTLVFEMFFYVVFALALALRLNVLIFCSVIFTACAAGGWIRPDSYSPALVYLSPLLLYFVAGMVIGRWVVDRARRPAVLWLGYLGLAWSLDAAVRSGSEGFALSLLLRPVLVVITVVVCVMLEPVTSRYVPRFLTFMGDASYSLYLFHPFIGPVVPIVLARLHLVHPWVSVALTFPAALLGGALIYFWVERPTTRRLQRLMPGLKSKPAAADGGHRPAELKSG